MEFRVLGRMLGQPAMLAPPVGFHQEIVIAATAAGGVAVLIHRFAGPEGRLPRSFFNPGKVWLRAELQPQSGRSHERLLAWTPNAELST